MLSLSRNSLPLTECEGSLPCSKQPNTGPYPDPNESILYHYTLPLCDQFQYYPHILPLSIVSSLQVLLQKLCLQLRHSATLNTCLTHLIILNLTI